MQADNNTYHDMGEWNYFHQFLCLGLGCLLLKSYLEEISDNSGVMINGVASTL